MSSHPDFLVIGAMKAGTTTLYHDLRRHPHLFLPEKEIGALGSDDVLTATGARRYGDVFAGRRPGQLAGDVSTTYAMAPTIEGCARRAHKLSGGDLRIIYLVRDPIERILSHHHHERQQGTVTVGIDQAVRTDERFIAYSQYARQLRPWIEVFGLERISIVALEDYCQAREATIAELCASLGVEADAAKVDGQIHNASAGKATVTGMWRAVRDNGVYRRFVRPLLSPEQRTRFRHVVLPPSTLGRDRLDRSTLGFLSEALADDLDAQRAMPPPLGRWALDRLTAPPTSAERVP